MKNLFKRSLAVVLALVMCVSMMNLTAFAEEPCPLPTVEKFHFNRGNHYSSGVPHYIPATCTEPAKWAYTCDLAEDRNSPCGAEYGAVEVGPALGHNIANGHGYQAPTCTKDGHTGWGKCTRCGHYVSGETIPATGHNYEGTVTTPATCTSTGTMTYVCKNDSRHRYTEEIPAKGHTPATIEAVPADCDHGGKTAGVECSVCHTILEAPTDTGKTEHAWGAWQQDTATQHKRVCANYSTHIEYENHNGSTWTWHASSKTDGGHQWQERECETCHYKEYRQITATLTITYVNEKGETVATGVSKEVNIGSTFSESSPTVNGLKTATATVSGTMGAKTVTRLRLCMCPCPPIPLLSTMCIALVVRRPLM